MRIFHFVSALIFRTFAIPSHKAEAPSISNEQAKAMNEIGSHLLSQNETSGNTSENGLNGPCKAVSIVYARGTFEPGNVGNEGMAGPALFANLRESLRAANIAVQGVEYKADGLGYLQGGDSEGSQEFLDVTRKFAAKCPHTKIVISGFSQGAQLAHNAAKKFSRATRAQIPAAVLFGDPFLNKTLGRIPSSRVLSICHDEDIICKGYGDGAAHSTYGNDSRAAADFVVARILN
ncbi:hypothetical protein K3495_g10943 [Podosphaera aphanis]|nr:hypothetical protein K3495_g10943 [Podosphaera aphanis]